MMNLQAFPSINIEGDDISASLPEWLNDLLFDDFHARNEPSGPTREFDRNLDAGEDKILRYLGTYFPRSLLETYIIFDSLFAEKRYLQEVDQNDGISVLSIGSGTGGDLLGLLLALKHNLITSIPVTVASVEGNKKAHQKLVQIIKRASEILCMDINLTIKNYTITMPAPFSGIKKTMGSREKFDFVITSKMLNELVSLNLGKDLYYEFCQTFAPMLSKIGLLTMIDVASPVGESKDWVPVLLNGQTNAYILESEDFRTVLPLICNGLESTCAGGCYSQYKIKVSHRNCCNYSSKMCFRVIALKKPLICWQNQLPYGIAPLQDAM